MREQITHAARSLWLMLAGQGLGMLPLKPPRFQQNTRQRVKEVIKIEAGKVRGHGRAVALSCKRNVRTWLGVALRHCVSCELQQ